MPTGPEQHDFTWRKWAAEPDHDDEGDAVVLALRSVIIIAVNAILIYTLLFNPFTHS